MPKEQRDRNNGDDMSEDGDYNHEDYDQEYEDYEGEDYEDYEQDIVEEEEEVEEEDYGQDFEEQDDQDDQSDDSNELDFNPASIINRFVNNGNNHQTGFSQNSGGFGRPGPLSFVDMIQMLVGGGGDNGELGQLMNNLNQRDDPFILQESLNEISSKLLMMNPVSAERMISPSKLARSVVDIMNDPILSENLELQLVACRCLYNLMEVNLDYIHDVVNNNAVELVIKKISEISFIDLTEQALQSLEMMTRDVISHNAVISNNGLKACLQYLDFLMVHSQRKCLIIVANSCTNISILNFDMINDVFEDISNVVKNHSDSIVIENAWLAISRIVSSFQSHSKELETLFASRTNLLQELVSTIVISANRSSNSSDKVPVSFNTCLALIKSLITLVSTSVDISGILILDISIGECIVKAINKFSKNESNPVEAIMASPNELLSQFLTLIGYLLPINYIPQETPFLKNSHEEFQERQIVIEKRIELCKDLLPNDYWRFVNDIWPFLINSFQALMDFEVRRKILINIFRIIKFMAPEDISKVDGFDKVSILLASVINQNKNKIGLSQPDVEMKNSEEEEGEEVEEDGSEEEEEEEEELDADIDNNSRINEYILLFSTSLLVFNLIKLLPATFISSFEKEGLITDSSSMLNHLKHMNLHDLPNDDYEQAKPFISIYANKFSDMEFTKGYFYKLNSNKVLNKLYHILTEIEELYTQSKENGSIILSEATKVLIDCKEVLNGDEKYQMDFDDWLNLWSGFKDCLIGEESVSSFELISSGIIEVLTKAFDLEQFGTDSWFYNAFVTVFFNKERHIGVLVNKLQESLTRSESFDIITSGGNTNQPMRLSSIYDTSNTAGMARQVKLKLAYDEFDKKIPHAFLNNVVLSIHAIATFNSIETFLKQRLEIFESSEMRNPFEELGDEDDLAIVDDETEDATEEDSPEETHIQFEVNGEVIPNETTIYGAIYRSLQTKPDEVLDPSRIWGAIHQIKFKKVKTASKPSVPLYNSDTNFTELDAYDTTTVNILKLLKIIFEVNEFAKSLHYEALEDDKFMNWKLSVKLNRQLEEPLIVASGSMPGWAIHVTRQFPFLFPLETRIFFLQSTSFGYSRLIHQWQLRTEQDSSRPQLGRPLRHKVRISRKLILQSAMKVMNLYGTSPGVLEIEYFDEVGTGLGPTLEFYSNVSKEFSKRKLKLWRDDEMNGPDEGFIVHKTGLFPRPMDEEAIQSENGKKVLILFSILGTFIARAMLDSRIIDFKFNPLFLKVIQIFNEHSINKQGFKDLKKINNLNSLRIVDSQLADSMEHLMKYVELFKHANEKECPYIEVDDVTLEDLALTFVLPGYEYELIENGSNIPITHENIELYISKVIEATLYNGIIPQTKAFMEGFSKVFPITSLTVFTSQELASLFGNNVEDWSYETLESAIHANHGFSKESTAIHQLIEILMEFNEHDKRLFLQFLTGAPRLPIGGFKSLKPELTVVRKYPEDQLKDDDYLPSVMTCANYLKLPSYSCKEVMKQKLVQAIEEGADAFLLS